MNAMADGDARFETNDRRQARGCILVSISFWLLEDARQAVDKIGLLAAERLQCYRPNVIDCSVRSKHPPRLVTEYDPCL